MRQLPFLLFVVPFKTSYLAACLQLVALCVAQTNKQTERKYDPTANKNIKIKKKNGMVKNGKSPLPPTTLQKGRSVGYRRNLAKKMLETYLL